MTGEPKLRRRLSGLLETTRSLTPIRAINIPSLGRREVASYIDMKLYHAGLERRGRFSRATIGEGRAAAHSHGLPVPERNRRSGNADAARALVLFRGILPRLWGSGR